MAIKLTLEDKIFQWASGEYLTEQMPEEVVTGSDEAMLDFINEYVIEPFEFVNTQDILESIAILAEDSQRFFTEIKDEMND